MHGLCGIKKNIVENLLQLIDLAIHPCVGVCFVR